MMMRVREIARGVIRWSWRYRATSLNISAGNSICGIMRSRVARRSCSPRSITARRRSEEHTSELQSLMRISYAVFCLKKKQHERLTNPHHNINATYHETPHITPSHSSQSQVNQYSAIKNNT